MGGFVKEMPLQIRLGGNGDRRTHSRYLYLKSIGERVGGLKGGRDANGACFNRPPAVIMVAIAEEDLMERCIGVDKHFYGKDEKTLDTIGSFV